MSVFPTLAAVVIAGALTSNAMAQPAALNLYSARHYQTDEALYDNFTKATGIKINRVDADDAGILARLKTEGSASPADVILLSTPRGSGERKSTDCSSRFTAKLLQDRIPAQLRGKDDGQGSQWYGFSTRARVVVYNKAAVKTDDVDTYEELADPKNKGRLCTRSGSHPYNLSLFGAMYEHLGPKAAEIWLSGLVSNMARRPKVAIPTRSAPSRAGECGIALTNTYYLARLMRSQNPEDKAQMEKLGVVFRTRPVTART